MYVISWIRHNVITDLLDPLAYMTAKAYGMEEECQLILEACEMTEDQISMPTIGKPMDLARIVVPTHKANWPVKSTSHSFFEVALMGEVDGANEGVPATNGHAAHDLLDDDETAMAADIGGEEEDDAAGWDMGDDINVEVESDFVNIEAPELGPGSNEADLWARNSPIAADHAAAGSFDTAMQLLNRQVGAVHFEPLKPRFMEIYQASKTYLPATAGLPPLVNYVRRTVEETDTRKLLPMIPRDLDSISTTDLQEGYSAMRSNKLEDGVKSFKRILHGLLVNAVSTQQQVSEAKRVIGIACEYTVGMTMELERRAMSTDTVDKLKRSLELSAYFTVPKLEAAHHQLVLMAAMKLAASHKNYSSALNFANKMLANGQSPRLLETVSLLVDF